MMNVHGASCFTKEEGSLSFSDPWLEARGKPGFTRMSVKYTEHTYSQSGTQDLKQCQITQCNRCSAIVQKMGTFIVKNTSYCLCVFQSLKTFMFMWRVFNETADCSAGKEQTLDSWLSQPTLATVGSGQGFPIRYSMMAKPWQKRQGTIWIQPIRSTWPAGHGFEYPLLKAAGSYQQMLVSARQSTAMVTIALNSVLSNYPIRNNINVP